jgi:predicted MPP superfamily phosphohydrolase
MIKKFGQFIQIFGGHSEIIQPNITSQSFINFKKILLNKSELKKNQIITTTNETNNLKLNKEYLKKINDIGIKLAHPNKNDIYLDDIFIFQDLQDIEDKEKVKISSSKLLEIKEFNKCLIFGEDVSGKTTLAYILQKEFNNNGFIPIYFNAKNIKKYDINTLKKRMYLNLRKQYKEIDKNKLDDFIKNNKNHIVIIIDNLENLAMKNIKSKALFLNMLDENFDKVFLFSNDSFEMEVMTKDELKSKLNNFKIFRIKELGYKLRDKLVEKWVYIGNEEEIEENYLFEKKDEISKAIETIVGNKFIPTYPLYIISLLQQVEAGTSNNLGGSAYAEFYNYLISQALGTTNIKPDELDFYYSYLSYIAYYYFKNGRKELDESEIIHLHENFSREIHKKPFHTVINNLINAKLIKKDTGHYSFGHNYIYYFFVAKYLSDNMDKRKKKEEIQTIISELIKRLYRPQFANIIIFLIHHSKTRAEYIIDKIINEAQKLFNDIEPATLSKNELIKINELIHEEIEVILNEDRTPQKHRERT